MKIYFKKILPILILAALTCLYFFNIIAAKNFLWEDFPVYYFPAKSYVFNSLKNKKIPLWNQNVNLGYPIIADTSAAIFYPLNWLAVPFMVNNTISDYYVIEIWAIFHLLLAGLFMYYLVDYLIQENKKSKKQETNPAALFSAIAFMFSGFFIGHLKHVAQINTACWFPLIFLFLYRSFKEKKYSLSIYAGIFWGISILGGHLQIAYHFSFFLGLFILWEIIFSFINKKNYKNIIISSLIAIIIATSLSAIQTLPFLEFLNNSTRKSVTKNFASSFSLKPTEFLNNLILPHNYGGFKQGVPYTGYGGVFWETSVYVGILTLIFAIIALIKNYKKNNMALFLIFFSLVCLFLAFGKYSVFHPAMLNIIPGLKMIRAPARFVLPVIFSICLLSGFGFNYFIKFLKKINKDGQEEYKNIKSNFLKILKFFLVVIILLLFILSSITTQNQNLFSGIFTIGSILLAITILTYLYLKKYQNEKFFITGLVSILFVDVFLFGWQFNNGKIKPKEYYPKNQITEFLESNSAENKRTINNDFFMPNAAYYYNFPIMESSHYMITKDYYDFTSGLAENLYYYNKARNFDELFENKNRLNLIGINNIVSETDFSKWFPEKKLEKIYINNEAYPRFLLSEKSVSVNNPQEILKLLDNADYDPNKIIYINEKYNKQNQTDKIGKNNIEITEYKNEYIKLEIKNNGKNWLLANEIYYPGWQAKINGKEIKIYKANYTFRAIPITQGKHTVEFIFDPKSYYDGKIISLFTFFISIIVGISNFCYNKNKGVAKSNNKLS